MFDPETETLISPQEACRLFPGRAGNGISRCTIWRWMLAGRRGVKLDSILAGGRYTSKESIARFLREINASSVPREDQRVDRPRESQAVDALLDAEKL